MPRRKCHIPYSSGDARHGISSAISSLNTLGYATLYLAVFPAPHESLFLTEKIHRHCAELGKAALVFCVPGEKQRIGKVHFIGGFDSSDFWRTSFSKNPPDPHSRADAFLLGLDERLNLALVGSLPHDAVGQVRIHWLLDLVQGRLEDGQPSYNFSHLDTLLDHLWRHQLRPGFELMGNPGNIFTDFENETQVLWWRNLVAQTARRYADRYGLEWVSSWNWESWNEPDHHDFDNLNFTLSGFLNYFDSCRAGLDDVTEQLILGGPGGSCRDPSFSLLCWALLGHCDHGSSFFTPGRPPRIDFISFHKKGQEDADSILTQELETIEKIRRNYPHLRHVPIVNDEGDFLKGWWRSRSWRADGRYAGLVARAVYTHHEALSSRPRLNYQLISFDNSFLNYFPNFFEQRSLVARFQINSTSPRQVQMVKKDSYSVLALLSLLGDHVLSKDGDLDGLSVISTCRGCRREEPSVAEDPRDSGSKNPPTENAGKGAEATPTRRTTENRRNRRAEATPTHTPTADLEPRNDVTPPPPQDPRKNSTENFPRERTTKNRRTATPPEDLETRTLFETAMGNEAAPNETARANLPSRSAGPSAWEATILVARSNGTRRASDGVEVKVVLKLPQEVIGERLALVSYQLGGDSKGPYEAWLDLRRPVEPSRKELAFIRSHEGSRREGPRFLVASRTDLTMAMTLQVPDVRVIHVCRVFEEDPGKVSGVRALEVTRGDLLLTWSDSLINTRCVFGYQVEWSAESRDGPYSSITRRLLHHNNFLHSLPSLHGNATIQGWYRVRVVTYWGTSGRFSRPIFHRVG
ncbi:alpha-L-iduronidase-like [Penaeus indicus]|uniref:alpha-L-iduronidase-like n=1 Tax=Penaeus indicus TaxID=29960 RepID=UPI00300D4BB8